MDLEMRFQKAQQDVSGFLPKEDRLQMLKLYTLYKQATQGDAKGKRPPITQMVKRVQWDAWKELQGMPKQTAMENYIALVESIRPA